MDEPIVIHARPVAAIMTVLAAAFFSLLIIGAGGVLVYGRGHATLIWLGIGMGCLLGVATAFRLRAGFDLTGIRIRNAFRARSFRWPEIAAIRVIPSVWYCSEPSWAAAMLEVSTRGGESFPLRVCTHLKRSQVEALSAFLRARAAEHGFEAPRSLIKLWKVEAQEWTSTPNTADSR